MCSLLQPGPVGFHLSSEGLSALFPAEAGGVLRPHSPDDWRSGQLLGHEQELCLLGPSGMTSCGSPRDPKSDYGWPTVTASTCPSPVVYGETGSGRSHCVWRRKLPCQSGRTSLALGRPPPQCPATVGTVQEGDLTAALQAPKLCTSPLCLLYPGDHHPTHKRANHTRGHPGSW